MSVLREIAGRQARMPVLPGIQEGKKAMADKIVVEGAPRETRGKNEARRLRQAGKLPAVLYGGKGEAITLAVNTKQVSAILRSETGHNTLFQVDLAGKHEPAILKDWLVDPVTGNLLHVDLLRVAMDVRMKVKVPVHTFGEPSGVKVEGGVFEVVTREVEIECLPADIPTEFKMDVSGLALNAQLRAADLPMGAVSAFGIISHSPPQRAWRRTKAASAPKPPGEPSHLLAKKRRR